jgi:hypothetical protein
MPAFAGIHDLDVEPRQRRKSWMPAEAGMSALVPNDPIVLYVSR